MSNVRQNVREIRWYVCFFVYSLLLSCFFSGPKYTYSRIWNGMQAMGPIYERWTTKDKKASVLWVERRRKRREKKESELDFMYIKIHCYDTSFWVNSEVLIAKKVEKMRTKSFRLEKGKYLSCKHVKKLQNVFAPVSRKVMNAAVTSKQKVG